MIEPRNPVDPDLKQITSVYESRDPRRMVKAIVSVATRLDTELADQAMNSDAIRAKIADIVLLAFIANEPPSTFRLQEVANWLILAINQARYPLESEKLSLDD